jgi:hypothetical protein
MEFLTALWMPILLSAVAVFAVSAVIHMVLKYHANDFKKFANQDAIQASLRPHNLQPGDYCLPRAGSMKEMGEPAFVEKLNQGPVAVITVMKNGPMNMGKSLSQWFLYSLLVSILAAYVGYHAVPASGSYLSVFRFVGCSAFMGYSLALMQGAIWYGRNWCTVLITMFDGLLYALVTAGTFGWLWPK